MRREYPKGTRSSSHTVENERIARHAAPQSQHAGSFQSDEPPCLLFTIYIVADLIANDQQGMRIGSDGGSEATRGICALARSRVRLVVAPFSGELESAMNGKICRLVSWMSLIFLNLFPISLGAQLTPNPTQASATLSQANGASQSAPQSLQALSQTAFLPLFPVDIQFDPPSFHVETV